MSHRLDRDSIVEKGIVARRQSESSEYQKGPWIYKAKVKSGIRSTLNVERECTNIKHLMGTLVESHARDNETLNVYGVQRVMKASLRSQREDI